MVSEQGGLVPTTLLFYWTILLSFVPFPRFLFCRGISVGASRNWEDLEAKILPPVPPPTTCLDYKQLDNDRSVLLPEETTTLRLFRERNGWCVYSARLWLALEIKGLAYDTVLVETRGDTYDGGDEDATGSSQQGGGNNDDGRPEFLGDILDLPILQYPNDSKLQSAATESSSLKVLQDLDARFPQSTPLFGLEKNGDAVCSTEDIFGMARAFGEAVPADARESPRAAWLFCNEEGFRLDALPRSTFESFLDAAEGFLSKHSDGPYFCGSTISAADIVWAPLLERYAAQLPCLHRDLVPRDAAARPNLYAWYRAMDLVPAYACRVKGDAASWRKVLYVDPWWPREDLWYPRDTVGPKGELWISEDECQTLFGGTKHVVSRQTWSEYAKNRPFVSSFGPGSELAAALIRNRSALAKDATRWMDREEYEVDFTALELDAAFREIAWELHLGDLDDTLPINAIEIDDFVNNVVSRVLAYLDDRLCVPRDMGAPSAASLRQLRSEFVDRFGDPTQRTKRRKSK